MERRNFVKTGLAGAAVGLMGSSLAMAENHQHDHDDKPMPVAPAMSSELKKVADKAYDCVRDGNVCIAECNRVLATGDGAMADCQQAVMGMVPVCDAMATNATLNLVDPALMKNLAKVCSEFCDYCAAACEPHAEHNKECKDCMESCNKLADACAAYLKA